MKKLLVLMLTLAYCFSGISAISSKSWVKTEDKKINCAHVLIRNSKAKITLEDGSKALILLAQINSYSNEGKIFTRLNLYQDGKPTGREVFMQLLSTREDYCLYRYYRQDAEAPYYCYYIYKNGELCYSLDESMASSRIKNLFQYFGFTAVFA